MMNKLLSLAVLCAFACESVSATQYSKLSVITSAKQRGCWTSLKAFIADADLKDEWDCCQYLSDDYPQFAAVTNALVASGVASAADVAYILSNSVDTAVFDACLRRVYDRDVKSYSGRVKWHGRLLRSSLDTTTLTKVSYYEDGSTFIDRPNVATPLDAVRKANARLSTNGVPARLATSRLRRQAEASAGVSNVTVNVKAGGKLNWSANATTNEVTVHYRQP